jgi:hypothetical protein
MSPYRWMIARLRHLFENHYVESSLQIAGTDPVNSSTGRRAFRRFQLAVPALFRWREEEEHREVGCCANIGCGGLFVLSTKYPPLEAEVQVEVMLPAFDPGANEVRINCVGRVIRTQQSSHLSLAGFAVAGNFQ